MRILMGVIGDKSTTIGCGVTVGDIDTYIYNII